MPSKTKQIAFEWAERAGVFRLLQGWGGRPEDRLYVLAYHRVDTAQHRPWLSPFELSASPQQFEAQMQLLARHYRPVTVTEVLSAALEGAPLPANAVLVTVDDGYLDFQEVIFPVASQYGIRPLLFVPTGYVGQGAFWWDRLYRAVYGHNETLLNTPAGALSLRDDAEKKRAYLSLSAYFKRIPYRQARQELDSLCAPVENEQAAPRSTLDWDELRRLHQAGAAIAAHTHHHPILSQLAPEEARLELRQSQDLIRQHLGETLPVFAFPDGTPQAMSMALLPILQEEGFALAFTMISAAARLRSDALLHLPRLGVWPSLSLAQFHYHLTPLYYESA